MADERRTLEIEAKVKDFVTPRFKRMAKSVRDFSKRAVGTIRKVVRSVFNLKTALVSLVGILAGGAFLNFSRTISKQIDELGRWALKLKVGAAELSELAFAAEQVGLSQDVLVEGLKTIQERMDDASRGTATYAEHFADLGLSVRDADGNLKNVVNFLPELAGAVQDAANRGQDLTLFFEDIVGGSENMLELLLRRGPAALRAFGDEARRLGVVIDENMVKQAREYERVWNKLDSVLSSVARQLFVEVAPAIGAVADELAEFVAANKGKIVETFKDIGRFFLNLLDQMIQGIIEFVRALENAPLFGRKLIDEEQLRREMKDIQAILTARQSLVTLLREGTDISQLPLVGGGDRVFGAEKFDEILALTDQDLARMRSRLNELATAIDEGLAAQLDRGFERSKEALQRAISDFSSRAAGAQAPAIGPPRPGDIGPMGEDLSQIARKQAQAFRSSATALEQNRAVLIEVERAMLNLREPTREVRLELAKLDREAQMLQLSEELKRAGITGDELARRLLEGQNTIEAAFRRTASAIETEYGQKVQRALLELGPPTIEARLQLVELDKTAKEMALVEILRQAGLEAKEFADKLREGLELIRKAAKDAKDAILSEEDAPEGFLENFNKRKDDILKAFKDMDRFGREVADTLIGGGLQGLTDGLADIITGANSAKEAFRDFALSTLKLLAQVIAKLLIVKAIKLITGQAFAMGGIMPGEMKKRMPVKGYAQGGVARTPQIAVFGEGSSRGEAFVPLPDGRTIPVTLTGGRSPAINITINAMDAQDVHRVLVRNRHSILGVYRHAIESDNAQRQLVAKAAS